MVKNTKKLSIQEKYNLRMARQKKNAKKASKNLAQEIRKIVKTSKEKILDDMYFKYKKDKISRKIKKQYVIGRLYNEKAN